MKLMSPERHQHLVKCAAKTIELMGDGLHPDAALTKVARDEGLNRHEIELVSRSVNTAATLSHLAESKPEDKGDVFPITNAERVVAEVYDGGQNKSTEDFGKELKKEAPKPGKSNGDDPKDAGNTKNQVDAPRGRKVAGLGMSYQDHGNYLDLGPAADHAAVVREAFGPAAAPLPTNEENLSVKIARLDRMIDEARTRAQGAKDELTSVLRKVGQAFEPIDGPRFSKVANELAVQGYELAGQLLDAVFEDMELHRRGQARDGVLKTAALTAGERELVSATLCAESLVKRAIDCSAAQLVLEQERADLCKTAGKGGDKDDGGKAGGGNEWKTDVNLGLEAKSDLFNSPGALVHGGHAEGFSGLMKDVSDSGAGSSEAEKLVSGMQAHPLDVNARQELENHRTSSMFRQLLDDPYIGRHPVESVVQAFNTARQTNSKLGAPEMTQLVRQHLATEGGIPLDTMLRARKATMPGGDHQ